jgi:hypothetical protein
MSPRRTLARVGLKLLAAGLLAAAFQAPAQAGIFGRSWSCHFCTYGAKRCCEAPGPTLLNECNGYFPTRWSPWPCPQQHVPVTMPPAAAEKLPPAKLMPPVR